MKSSASTPAASRRRYNLGKRAAAAQATREAILRAARALVSTEGFANVTVDAVATRAGVSRLTVYNHFESKSGLLEALAWSIFTTADIDRIRIARLHPDVDTALDTFVRENTEFLAAIGPEGRTVLTAARNDPELGTVVDATYIAGRRAAIAELVQRLHEANRLRHDWTEDRAVAALMVITSLESFETLVTRHSWSTSEAGSMLAEMAAVVCMPEPPDRSARASTASAR
jgi:AcrR family transcriptional regulator